MKYTPDGDMEIDLSELAKILTDKIPSDILYSSSILVNNALVGDCGRILMNYKNEDVWRLYGFLHVSAGYWIKEVLRNSKVSSLKIRFKRLDIEYESVQSIGEDSIPDTKFINLHFVFRDFQTYAGDCNSMMLHSIQHSLTK